MKRGFRVVEVENGWIVAEDGIGREGPHIVSLTYGRQWIASTPMQIAEIIKAAIESPQDSTKVKT